MKKAAVLAVFMVLVATLLIFSPQQAEAIDYYGGKIIKRDKLSESLSKLLRSANVVARLTLESSKLVNGKLENFKETVFVAGAVAGNCRVGKSILGLGHRIKGRKVITLGICK